MVAIETDAFPHYMKIALSVAERIAQGDLCEGERLSGRSKLSSEYNVSPETVRKAMQLLCDMKVVEVKEQSGVVVISADNARRYLQSFVEKHGAVDKLGVFKGVLRQREELDRKLVGLCEELLDEQTSFYKLADRFPSFKCRVPEGSPVIGKNVSELQFWQRTGATVIAIKRAEATLVSPGPYAELYGGDTIIYVGNATTRQAVEAFLTAEKEAISDVQ